MAPLRGVPPAEPFTLRLPKQLHDELFAVIAATGNEVTRSGLIIRALEFYLHVLRHTPSLLDGYDMERDASVRHSGDPYDNGRRA